MIPQFARNPRDPSSQTLIMETSIYQIISKIEIETKNYRIVSKTDIEIKKLTHQFESDIDNQKA